MKQQICLAILLSFASLTFSERQSPFGDIIDGVRNAMTSIFGGKDSSFGKLIDEAMERFQFNDWKDRIVKFLEENAEKLSEKGQQEFDEAVKDLVVLRGDPDASKEDYRRVLEQLKSQTQ